MIGAAREGVGHGLNAQEMLMEFYKRHRLELSLETLTIAGIAQKCNLF